VVLVDRYSRLKLFEFADFTKLRDKNALVIGVGGLGALTSDILCRCGVGRLSIMDYDVLEEANLNRLIYKTSQIGNTKVDALKDYLKDANPDVEIATYPYDITEGKGYDSFLAEIEKADVIFGCVDTFHVRMFMNAKCVQSGKVLIDAGVSQNGINGSVHVIVPGKTPCYRCNRPLWKDEEGAPSKKRRDGSGICHFTSLPTTMAIIASLQAQEGLKFLLGFGKLASYLLYFGLEGKLERYDWKRDPRCPICGKVALKEAEEAKSG
jgi:ubiquitin-like modifier-activating enzyme 5